MSIPSLFPTRTPTKPDAVARGKRPHVNRSGKVAALMLLARRFQRRRGTGASYLNTGHLNEHVRKDIGLKRTDLAPPD